MRSTAPQPKSGPSGPDSRACRLSALLMKLVAMALLFLAAINGATSMQLVVLGLAFVALVDQDPVRPLTVVAMAVRKTPIGPVLRRLEDVLDGSGDDAGRSV